MSYCGALGAQPDRCRKQRYLRHWYHKYLIYYTAARLRNIRRSGLVLPRLFRHGVELSLKLSCTENGLVLDQMRRIRVHRQNTQTSVVKNVIYDTAPSSRHSVRIVQALLRLCCHGVGLSLKLSCTPKGRVIDEIHTTFRPAPTQYSI